ncbi:hypothetical protein BHM03_00030591 [Ensete ventricosum]|nr:hypothetical protein BHM03_00030591 [Ensete ventricosum]
MCVGGGRPLELRRQARHRLELSVRVERVRAADGVLNLLSPFPPRERPRGGDCRCGGSHGGGGQGGDTGFRGRSLGGIVVVVDGGETEAKRQPLADPRLPGYE